MIRELFDWVCRIGDKRVEIYKSEFNKAHDIKARRLILQEMYNEACEIRDGARNDERFMITERHAMLVAERLGYKVACDSLKGLKYVHHVDGVRIAFLKNGKLEVYDTSWILDNYSKSWYIYEEE